MVSAMISKGAGAALGATGLAATGQAAKASRALFAENLNPCTFTQVSLVYRTALGTTDMLLAQLSDSISPNAYRLFAGPQYTSGGTVDGTFTTTLAGVLGGGVGFRMSSSDTLLDNVARGVTTNGSMKASCSARSRSVARSVARTREFRPVTTRTRTSQTSRCLDAHAARRAANQ